MDTADRYRRFADREAWGVSPLYEEFALGVVQDVDVLAFLDTFPEAKRQPNLLFGTVKYLTGVMPDYGAFRGFVVGHQDDLRDLMAVRSTQTNDPGRCAVLLPLLAHLTQPIALLEVGASAGLSLLPDRYRYDYGGRRVGPADSPLPSRASRGIRCPCRRLYRRWHGGWEWISTRWTSPIRTRADGCRLWCGRVTPSAKTG